MNYQHPPNSAHRTSVNNEHAPEKEVQKKRSRKPIANISDIKIMVRHTKNILYKYVHRNTQLPTSQPCKTANINA